MKKWIVLWVVALLFTTGCKTDNMAGRAWNSLWKQNTETNLTSITVTNDIPEVVTLPDGTTRTNITREISQVPVEVVTTNYVANPNIVRGIQMAGDVSPFPWSGLVASVLVNALTLGANFKNRKGKERWKQAAADAVHLGLEVRTALKQRDADKDSEIKNAAIRRQRMNGTKDLIDSVLQKIK